MVRRLAHRVSWAMRCGIGSAILFAALAAPAPTLAAELSQPAPGSSIKRLGPPQGGGIGGLEGFQGHSTAPGKAGAIPPRQSLRIQRSVTPGADGAELRVISLGSQASVLAGVPPLPRLRPAPRPELGPVSSSSGVASPGPTRLRPGMKSLRWPLEGAMVGSVYGPRRHPILGGTRSHGGVDLPAPSGTPVRAAAAGTVRYVGRNGSYGRFIRLDHGFGLETAYGHLRGYARDLRRDRRVRRGEVIGNVGSSGLSTGPHLHYEVRIDGRAIDPLPIMPTVARRIRAR